MKFFLEIADNVEIQKLNDLGIVDGVTTNPTLIAKSERPIREVLAEIYDLVDKPVSGERSQRMWRRWFVRGTVSEKLLIILQ